MNKLTITDEELDALDSLHKESENDQVVAAANDVVGTQQATNFASAEELNVAKITETRFNKLRKRDEWKVYWSNGTNSWEPLDNLLDGDGTQCVELLKFDLRIEMMEEMDKENIKPAQNTRKTRCVSFPYSSRFRFVRFVCKYCC